jgi:peptidoglycan/xylan/chitin deacetylase (PgdA/CDA1 family)
MATLMKKRHAIMLIILALAICFGLYEYRFDSNINYIPASSKEGVALPYQNQYGIRDFTDKIEFYGKATKVPVLMYHHILEAKDKKTKNSLVITTREFERQMDYLFVNDYTTITVRELEQFLNNELVLPKKCVLITFDDGYTSAYKYAYPILQSYGFKATVSLIPRYMPMEMRRFSPARVRGLSWQEVVQGSDVFEYINHTYSHTSMKGISYSKAFDEIKKAGELIQSEYFVYPVGHTSVNSERALRNLDYKLAFTTKPGFVRKSSSRLYLPRQRISAGMSLSAFASLLQ